MKLAFTLRLALALAPVLCGSVTACRGQVSEDPPIGLPARNMHFQQRYNAQSEGQPVQRPAIDAHARGGDGLARGVRYASTRRPNRRPGANSITRPT